MPAATMQVPVHEAPSDPLVLQAWLSERSTEMRASAAEHGAVIIQGVPDLSTDVFEEIASLLLGGQPAGYRGGDSPRELLGDGVYTSTSLPATESLPLHNEMSYSNRYPARVLFGCMQPARAGGNTPLCDGRQLLGLIPESFLEKAVENGLTYFQRMHSGQGYGKSWMDTFETSDREEMETWLSENQLDFSWTGEILTVAETIRPVVSHPETREPAWFAQVDQWHPSSLDPEIRDVLEEVGYLYHDVTFGDGSPIDDEDARRIGELGRQLAWSRPWTRGDVMLIDNLIALHGREPYDGSPRRILVSML